MGKARKKLTFVEGPKKKMEMGLGSDSQQGAHGRGSFKGEVEGGCWSSFARKIGVGRY